MKEIEETNKWRDDKELEELIMVKCSNYPKPSTDAMQSLPKYQLYFSQKQKNFLKFL